MSRDQSAFEHIDRKTLRYPLQDTYFCMPQTIVFGTNLVRPEIWLNAWASGKTKLITIQDITLYGRM